MDDALIDAGTIGGKMVGIPLSTSLVSFIYNPSVLEEAGVTAPQNVWTWDDLCFHLQDRQGKDRQVRLRRSAFTTPTC